MSGVVVMEHGSWTVAVAGTATGGTCFSTRYGGGRARPGEPSEDRFLAIAHAHGVKGHRIAACRDRRVARRPVHSNQPLRGLDVDVGAGCLVGQRDDRHDREGRGCGQPEAASGKQDATQPDAVPGRDEAVPLLSVTLEGSRGTSLGPGGIRWITDGLRGDLFQPGAACEGPSEPLQQPAGPGPPLVIRSGHGVLPLIYRWRRVRRWEQPRAKAGSTHRATAHAVPHPYPASSPWSVPGTIRVECALGVAATATRGMGPSGT